MCGECCTLPALFLKIIFNFSLSELVAITLKTPSLGWPGQCIMKERPVQKVEAGWSAPPLRCAVQGFAPLRRR
jgi:hypothetical protein